MYDFNLRHARDLAIPITERASDVRRERSVLDAAVQPVFGAALRVWMRIGHRIEITGRDNLPLDPPYMMVANHTSHIDTPALLSALPACHRDAVYPIAAEDVFFTSKARAAVTTKLINALPVRRGRPDRKALMVMRSRLTDDRPVMILYPEGMRNDGSAIGPFLPGIGLLVAGVSVPVVPCRLHGCEAALPKGCFMPRLAKISLRIGKPLTFEHEKNCKRSWQAIASELQNAVESL